MLDGPEILNLLKVKHVLGIKLLSEYVCKELHSNSKMYDYSYQLSNTDDGEFKIADDDDNETTDDLNMDDDNNDRLSSNDDYTDEGEQDDTQDLLNTTKDDFIGINVFNTDEPHIKNSYFSYN